MRLFTALDPSPEVYENLERLLSQLRSVARIRWSRPENLHLTVKFIGEWPEDKLPALGDALRKVPEPPPFDVQVSRLGFFPNAKAPRVFWAGVNGGPELDELANQVDKALTPLGIAPEQRSYSPHLTLARIPVRTPMEGLHRAIQALASGDFGRFMPDRLYLYESRPGPGGSLYSKMKEFPWNR